MNHVDVARNRLEDAEKEARDAEHAHRVAKVRLGSAQMLYDMAIGKW